MKRTLLLIIFFAALFPLNAQEPGESEQAKRFQGKATYFSKRVFKKGVEGVGVKADDDAQLKMAYEAALKEASEKTYTLTFNKKEALYEQDQNLEKPKPKTDGVSVSITFSGEGKKYLNIPDKIKITEDQIIDKDFLIIAPLQPLDWKLADATKKIGDYTCHKAEVIIPASEKEKKAYADYLKKQETKASLFPREEPTDRKVTAWYTADIPVSVGPLNFWGLPGLILELSDEETIILCSKVVLSQKEAIRIKVPNSGTKVTQAEFDDIHEAKMKRIYGED